MKKKISSLKNDDIFFLKNEKFIKYSGEFSPFNDFDEDFLSNTETKIFDDDEIVDKVLQLRDLKRDQLFIYARAVKRVIGRNSPSGKDSVILYKKGEREFDIIFASTGEKDTSNGVLEVILVR